MKRLILLAAAMASLPAAALAQDTSAGAPRLFSAEDVFELEWADDPQISPDGTKAIYLRRFNDIQDRKSVV